MSRALVLGGGGPVGIAWEAGVAAGLAEAGVDVAKADRIIGTSAGSFVGAQLAGGRSAASLAQAQIDLGAKEAEAKARAPKDAPAPRMPDLAPLFQLMIKPMAAGETPESRRAEFGRMALAADTLDEAAYIAGFGRLGDAAREWPESFACTAVDAETGAFVVWDKASGAGLAHAVASSCSVPGVFPPITIAGRRYIDGGVRSPTCIDLAKGADVVLILAVVSEMGREAQMARIEQEQALLGDARSLLIVPDTESLAAFGPNLMDAARRGAIAEAGMAQGRREAARIQPHWR